MEEDPTFIESAVEVITDFAASYTPQVLIVVGLAVAIGLGIWGFTRLIKLFRRTAS